MDDGRVDGPPYRVARRLCGLIIGHWAYLDARFTIDGGVNLREVDPAQGANTAYWLLSQGMEPEKKKVLDRYLTGPEWDALEPDVKNPDAPEPEDDPDWRPSWWKDET